MQRFWLQTAPPTTFWAKNNHTSYSRPGEHSHQFKPFLFGIQESSENNTSHFSVTSTSNRWQLNVVFTNIQYDLPIPLTISQCYMIHCKSQKRQTDFLANVNQTNHWTFAFRKKIIARISYHVLYCIASKLLAHYLGNLNCHTTALHKVLRQHIWGKAVGSILASSAVHQGMQK